MTLRLYQFLFFQFLNFTALVIAQGDDDCTTDADACYPSADNTAFLGTSFTKWTNCTTTGSGMSNQKAWINGGYDDAHKIVSVDGTYQNIQWTKDVALDDFFGPSAMISSDVRGQIQNIFGNLEQTYDGSSWNPIYHRLPVACGNEDTDCYVVDCNTGQKVPNPDLEAYTEQDDKGNNVVIIFCPLYFQKETLDLTLGLYGHSQDPDTKWNLENYENRGRLVLHELAHLKYWMQVTNGQENDWVIDYKMKVKGEKKLVTAYGAQDTKILAKYITKTNPAGNISSMNADSYAQFALSKYVQAQLGSYPYKPAIERSDKPLKKPVPAFKTRSVVLYSEPDGTGPVFDDTTFEVSDSNTDTSCLDDEDVSNNPDGSDQLLTLDTDLVEDSSYSSEYGVESRAWLANSYQFPALSDLTLNILTLGDSITNGYQSSDGNGYREHVVANLSQCTVTMIGSLQAGTMTNNENDGYPGATIDQIASNPDTASSLASMPNVVLLHAGTVDMNQNQDVTDAPTRLGNLIDQILDSCPNATIFVASLIPSADDATQANIIQYNYALPAVVAARSDAGHEVFLVDMFRQLDQYSDLADELYPNDSGYEKMGETWLAAMNYAYYELGWIANAPGSSVPPGTGPCVPVGQKFDPSLTLRILPLGASITWGVGSSDLTGFRNDLRELLVSNGASVNYVGTIENGDMVDDDVEGHPGFRIDQVAEAAENALPFLPNLVIMHVGTNDAVQDYELDTAAERFGALIDRVLSAIPGVVVLVSTIIVNLNAGFEANIETINSQIPAMVAERANAGKYVYLVDMHDGYITTSDIHTSDKTHPTDVGYVKMANVWYKGIQDIYSKCWFTPPAPVAGLSDVVPEGVLNTNCYQLTKYADGPHTVDQSTGQSDGSYEYIDDFLGHMRIPLPNMAKGLVAEGVHWADIDGDGIDDFVYVFEQKELIICLNQGDYSFLEPCTVVNTTMPCTRRGIRFGDFDGDGRDDFLCILYPKGGLVVYLNTPGDDPSSPNWDYIGEAKLPEDGFDSSNIMLGDIDGDGRIDYMAVDPGSGAMTGWRNERLGSPYNWEHLGFVVPPGLVSGYLADLRFVDLNGDGRDDLVFVDDTGETRAWINNRGSALGLAPEWDSVGLGATSRDGITNSTQVSFGNVWGHKDLNTYPDYNGRGADYVMSQVLKKPQTQDDEYTTYMPITLYKNVGHGGTRQPGDLVRWCDMRGSGADDFVSIEADGTIGVHGNFGSSKEYGNVYSPGASLMAGRSIKDVHLADFDGDGDCDYLIVDPVTNAVHLIRNDYSTGSDTFAWTDVGSVSAGISCDNTYGPGQFDLAVRFADINGDGRTDFLCLDPDGRTTAWLNHGNNNWESLGQIKYSVKTDRANVRFADTNGDGLADYVHVNKDNGAVTGWVNRNITDPATHNGSSIAWSWKGVISPANHTRGENVYFANLNGEGRADVLYVDPSSGSANIYLNVCPLRNPNPPMAPLPHLAGDPYAK